MIFPIFTLTVRKERFWQFFLSNGAKLPSSMHTRNKILYLAYSTDVPGLSCKSDLSILASDLGELWGVFWHLRRVWVCISHSRCPLLNERAFPARQTRSHTHQTDAGERSHSFSVSFWGHSLWWSHQQRMTCLCLQIKGSGERTRPGIMTDPAFDL